MPKLLTFTGRISVGIFKTFLIAWKRQSNVSVRVWSSLSLFSVCIQSENWHFFYNSRSLSLFGRFLSSICNVCLPFVVFSVVLVFSFACKSLRISSFTIFDTFSLLKTTISFHFSLFVLFLVLFDWHASSFVLITNENNKQFLNWKKAMRRRKINRIVEIESIKLTIEELCRRTVQLILRSSTSTLQV